ncbi:MAG: formimidoylglutamase [Bacteroidetes bacterium]|nr:formimidoylglutamase [Bacteroidota bacterium]
MINYYSKETIQSLIRKREGEIKLGEVIVKNTISTIEELRASQIVFVIIGIAEDIGVRANYGRAGAATAFKPALESFLNQQHNDFLDASKICVLGEVNTSDLMDEALHLHQKKSSDIQKLRNLTEIIDARVSDVIQKIVSLNKIPIIIGGGHNNAYGNIKGASIALDQKINVINCDPHLDFRALEGRHSGNGFSYAFYQNYLNNYSVFCLHEQHNNQASLNEFKLNSNKLFYCTYEDVFIKEVISFNAALQRSINFVNTTTCGIEIDLDAITNVPSSAKTSSGISPIQARQYIYKSALQLQVAYLHIAEGAPVLSHIKADNKTGKLISYLISDFIKAVLSKTQ